MICGRFGGRVLVAGTEQGICAVMVGEDDKTLIRQLRAEFLGAVLMRDRVARTRWIVAVQSCEREDPLLSKLPLDFRGRVFQAKKSGRPFNSTAGG
jgi:AraC family transcriptional regulator, regulatory protein of adaptative response / methylated-DNA-[protein]-cysteine methyltransferase